MSSGAICTPGEGRVVRAAIVMHGQARWVLAKGRGRPGSPGLTLVAQARGWWCPSSLGWSDGTPAGRPLATCSSSLCARVANGGPWGRLPGACRPMVLPADGGQGGRPVGLWSPRLLSLSFKPSTNG